MATPPKPDRRRPLIAVGLLAALAVFMVGVLILTKDDDDTTAGPTTSTTAATTTTTTTKPAFEPTVDPAVPIFPDPGTSQRFDDPVALVTAFATGPLGFSSPVVDPFIPEPASPINGDVAVRSFAEGAPTQVQVRRLADDTWFVVAARTDSIQLTTPVVGAAVTTPQMLAGMAYAAEGTVEVSLYADGGSKPIGTTVVTGRGDGVLGSFEGRVTFTVPAGVRYGYLLLTSSGGESGGTVAAQAVRVGF